MVMIHTHARYQDQKSVDSKLGVETGVWTDRTDLITFPANAVGNDLTSTQSHVHRHGSHFPTNHSHITVNT